MHVRALDHLVLTVRDIDATCDFYHRVLGMRVITFGEGRVALRFGNQKINLHPAGNEFQPCAAAAQPGAADLCFEVDADPQAVLAHIRAEGVEPLEGPVPRTGALGPITSIYFRDLDGNLIELASYEKGLPR